MNKQAKPDKTPTPAERIEKEKKSHDSGKTPSSHEEYPGPKPPQTGKS